MQSIMRYGLQLMGRMIKINHFKCQRWQILYSNHSIIYSVGICCAILHHNYRITFIHSNWTENYHTHTDKRTFRRLWYMVYGYGIYGIYPSNSAGFRALQHLQLQGGRRGWRGRNEFEALHRRRICSQLLSTERRSMDIIYLFFYLKFRTDI